jgi:hypothetical protein
MLLSREEQIKRAQNRIRRVKVLNKLIKEEAPAISETLAKEELNIKKEPEINQWENEIFTYRIEGTCTDDWSRDRGFLAADSKLKGNISRIIRTHFACEKYVCVYDPGIELALKDFDGDFSKIWGAARYGRFSTLPELEKNPFVYELGERLEQEDGKIVQSFDMIRKDVFAYAGEDLLNRNVLYFGSQYNKYFLNVMELFEKLQPKRIIHLITNDPALLYDIQS